MYNKATSRLFDRYHSLERNFMEVLLTGQNVSEREEVMLELLLNDLMEAHMEYCDALTRDQILEEA